MIEKLQELLANSSTRHDHLCPRQVLGVRLGLYAGRLLGLDLPQRDKRLFAFVECDGCGLGGIQVATGCWVDRRTVHVMDFGKLAATFVDTETGRAVRIRPHEECRQRVEQFVDDNPDRWSRQLVAYQVMPDEALFTAQAVQLTVALEKIIGQPGLRVKCARCGEEVMNGREVMLEGQPICRGCAGEGYYTVPDREIPHGVYLTKHSYG